MYKEGRKRFCLFTVLAIIIAVYLLTLAQIMINGQKVFAQNINDKGQIITKTVAATTAAGAGGAAPSLPPPSTANWHSYINSTYGIKILYPPNWIVVPRVQPNGTNNTGFAIIEFDPPISQDPNANTWFNVAIDNTTRKITPTLDEYVRNDIVGMRSNANVTDLKVIRAATNVTIAGRPGYLLYLTEKDRTQSVPSRTYLETGTIVGNMVYQMIINSDLPVKQFTTALLPQVIQMIRSFQILQPVPIQQQSSLVPSQQQNIPGLSG